MALRQTPSTATLADEDRPSTVVEPKPRATGLTLDEIVADHLDYPPPRGVLRGVDDVRGDRLPDAVVRPTVRIGDSQTGETVGNGALATVRWYDGEPVGDGHLQGQFAAFKDVVGDMLDKGVFTPSTARQYLKRKLAERVGDRQELRIPTGESPFEKASLNRS